MVQEKKFCELEPEIRELMSSQTAHMETMLQVQGADEQHTGTPCSRYRELMTSTQGHHAPGTGS